VLEAHTPAGTAEPFSAGSYSNAHGTRDYKLLIPSGYHGQPLPLIVMLHGCGQDPDDFAAGTRMNALAERNDCFVVYPSQTQGANPSRCWNWFEPRHQQRELGEPSLIAGITRQVMHTYHIDERRVFVAGMSAGGAMAVILAATYPELYAAAGVHSGMPYRAAQNMFAALTAMRGGSANSAAVDPAKSIPIIVFHGDEDATVHPRNGERIVSQSLAAAAPTVLDSATETAADGAGRAYARTIHRDADGNAVAEHWVVHGTGHAWSGGSESGSFTDARGPDASGEMLRFFLRQPPRPRQPHTAGRAGRGRFFKLLQAAGLG
jgi:poly(hydroxyalkanoate) depolymerase family esterase